VAGVVFVMQSQDLAGGTSQPMLAAKPDASLGVVAGVSVSPAASAVLPAVIAPGNQVMLVNDQRMIRDARLDRYLAQHRQFAEGGVAMPPGGVVRSVSTSAPDR
jgi:sigma-E factor negative regulatory protein RseA